MPLFLIVALLCFCAFPVHAQPTDREIAAKHLENGGQFFARKQYDLALSEFLACHAISKEPDILHNISLTYEMLGDVVSAIEYEKGFIDGKGSALSSEEKDQAMGRIVRLSQKSAVPLAKANKLSKLPIIPIALGAGLLGTSIATGAAAYATAKTLNDGMPRTASEIQGLAGTARAEQAAAIALGTLGSLAVVGGGIWLIIEYRRLNR